MQALDALPSEQDAPEQEWGTVVPHFRGTSWG
jgi:hypothetical protein